MRVFQPRKLGYSHIRGGHYSQHVRSAAKTPVDNVALRCVWRAWLIVSWSWFLTPKQIQPGDLAVRQKANFAISNFLRKHVAEEVHHGFQSHDRNQVRIGIAA
jgi:hypothetical protein